MHVNLPRELGTTAWVAGFSIGAVCLLLLPTPVLAHHGFFYKPVFQAIKNGDLDDIKDRFTKSAWKGTCRALSAAELQKRLNNGKLIPWSKLQALTLYERTSRDHKRSKCIVLFKLQYPDNKVERIWLLAEDVDSRARSWDWRIVRIVNDEKQAQSFFKHSLPK